MVHIRLIGVGQEEHVAEQSQQSVTNPQAVLVATPLEILGHLALRVEFRFQHVETVDPRREEVVAHVLGMHAEEPLQHTVVDEGSCKEFAAEGETVVLNLAHRKRQGR